MIKCTGKMRMSKKIEAAIDYLNGFTEKELIDKYKISKSKANEWIQGALFNANPDVYRGYIGSPFKKKRYNLINKTKYMPFLENPELRHELTFWDYMINASKKMYSTRELSEVINRTAAKRIKEIENKLKL